MIDSIFQDIGMPPGDTTATFANRESQKQFE